MANREYEQLLRQGVKVWNNWIKEHYLVEPEAVRKLRERFKGEAWGYLKEKSLRKLDLSGIDLSGQNLSGAILVQTNLRKANLQNANLSNAWLSEAYLQEADLNHANLYNVQLDDADLYKANLSNTNLNSAKLAHAGLRLANLDGARRQKIIKQTGVVLDPSAGELEKAGIKLEGRDGVSLNYDLARCAVHIHFVFEADHRRTRVRPD